MELHVKSFFKKAYKISCSQPGCFAINDIVVWPGNLLYGIGKLELLCFLSPDSPLIFDLNNETIIEHSSNPANSLALSQDNKTVFLLGDGLQRIGKWRWFTENNRRKVL